MNNRPPSAAVVKLSNIDWSAAVKRLRSTALVDCLNRVAWWRNGSASDSRSEGCVFKSRPGADTSKESDTKFLVKEVSKFIHRFDLKEDISLYLKLFERQAQRLNIDQENWVSHLLGLLPTEVSHIIAREPDDKANSYEHVKDLLLERFKLTPEKFRQLFVTHQKHLKEHGLIFTMS
ncbi:uncharacterized protein TNCV_4940001 [Trichonephila clavipes]|nr:uncharacterized protein TNCV_4940001 [Trichonephila clavipes]